jgi:hypothetical protein
MFVNFVAAERVEFEMDASFNLNGAPCPTPKRRVDLDGPDFFPTPPWATRALLMSEQFSGDIWEPACGDGAMAEVLSATGLPVTATDLYDHGYGETGVDFLTTNRNACNIITNPPYNSAEGFLHHALDCAGIKVALLLRLAFLEGSGRQRSIFKEKPPARVWVFSERVTFYPKGAKVAGSGTTAYAWFVWDRFASGPTELRWLPLKPHAGSSR